METKWDAIPPTTPGMYWFYGWDYGIEVGCGPSFYLLRVKQAANGILYILEGSFWNPNKGLGFYQPVILPEAPEETK